MATGERPRLPGQGKLVEAGKVPEEEEEADPVGGKTYSIFTALYNFVLHRVVCLP
jgi:hypothetical protein